MFRQTNTKDLEEDLKDISSKLNDEFLLIYVKLNAIDAKLDRLLALQEPEALLSQSEIDMMLSWRSQHKGLTDVQETHDEDNRNHLAGGKPIG